MSIQAIHMFEKQTDKAALYVNTCCHAKGNWQTDLSPFAIGPCMLYDGAVALNMENGWQYAKVYPEFATKNGDPKASYFEWANQGWGNPKAVRFPMGRGRKPLYSLWDGQKLDYISARKEIYVPLYVHAVVNTNGFRTLREYYKKGEKLLLRDYDGYRHEGTLTQVLNNPRKKMGHAFVLMMLLTNDPALKECKLCPDFLNRHLS